MKSAGPLRARFWKWLTARTLRRLLVRLLSLVGIGLLVVSMVGWWLATRVVSDQGFGDVVAKSVRQVAVRQYIAEQVSLKLAPTNKIFTAARPVATTLVSEALTAPVIQSTIRTIVAGVHRQVFRLGDNDTRVNVSAASAQATLRATLESIDTNLSSKFPDGVLNIATNITQNPTIDIAATAAPYIRWLYFPIGLLGALLLYLVLSKARDPVHAVRYTGFSMAIAGALPIGLGLATPFFAVVAGDSDPGRGKAVAAFVHVLLGRLVGAGWAFVLIGLLLAFAPGRDGSGVADRLSRARVWFDRARGRRLTQLLEGVVTVSVGVALLTVPATLLWALGLVIAVIVVFFGVLLLLRSTGVLETVPSIAPVRKRQLAAVAAAVVVSLAMTTTATAAVLEATKPGGRADPKDNGCNGYYELCLEPLNQIVWAASHNAMSSVAYNFFTAEHIASIPEQLNEGARGLLIDAYDGYKDSGLVRTILTGAANRQEISAELGNDALRELDRLGALTGVSRTAGKKQDVYLCHLFCEVGAVKASAVFSKINDWLNQNLTDVLVIDVEDYVSPADLEASLKAGHLWNRLYRLDPTKPMPRLLDLVNPPKGADQQQRRVILTSERHAGEVPWLIGSYQVMQETPYTFNSVDEFNCDPNRGSSGNPLLLVNHWLRAPGPPDPVEASKTNSAAELTRRLTQCIAVRHRLPNFVAVDFFGSGDTTEVVNLYNAAVAQLTGTTAAEDRAIARERADPKSTDAQISELESLPRLPRMSTARAKAILGPVATILVAPTFTG